MASSLCPSILTGLEMTCSVRGPSDCLKLTHKATVTGITAGLGSRHWKCQKAKGVYGRCHWGLGSSCNVCRTNNKQSTRKWPTRLARWRQGWVRGGGEEEEKKNRKRKLEKVQCHTSLQGPWALEIWPRSLSCQFICYQLCMLGTDR